MRGLALAVLALSFSIPPSAGGDNPFNRATNGVLCLLFVLASVACICFGV